MKPGLGFALATCAVSAVGIVLGAVHPLAAIALYPALGVLPGMAFAGIAFPSAPPRLRVLVGLALAPLVASTLG